MVLLCWATSPNLEANWQEYISNSSKESIHIHPWWKGQYLQLMPVWMVQMYLLLVRKNRKLPFQTEVLGRCLGPTQKNGNEMYQAILQMNGKMVQCRSICRLRTNELARSNKYESHKQAAFYASIQEKLGDSMKPPKLIPEEKNQILESVSDDDEQQWSGFLPEEDYIDVIGHPMNQKSITELLINSEVLLSQGEE